MGLHDGAQVTDLHYVWVKDARQLERELAAANERIRRLKEAGDVLAEGTTWKPALERWTQAKEAKP
jgi:hypothetical protein